MLIDSAARPGRRGDEPGRPRRRQAVSVLVVCDVSAVVALLLDAGPDGRWATDALTGTEIMRTPPWRSSHCTGQSGVGKVHTMGAWARAATRRRIAAVKSLSAKGGNAVSSRKIRILTAAIGAASALAIGGATIAASPANAFPVRICSPDGCKTVCRQALPNGNVVDYDEGAKMTITYPDGDRVTYKCKNGEWVETRTAVTRVIDSGAITSPDSIQLSPGRTSPLTQVVSTTTLSPGP